jgi:hypothetical protein
MFSTYDALVTFVVVLICLHDSMPKNEVVFAFGVFGLINRVCDPQMARPLPILFQKFLKLVHLSNPPAFHPLALDGLFTVAGIEPQHSHTALVRLRIGKQVKVGREGPTP